MKGTKPVIALLSPNQNAYSETFIQSHKRYLNGEIKYFFGGTLPNQLEGLGYLNKLCPPWILFTRLFKKIKNKITNGKIDFVQIWEKDDLKRVFIKNKIEIVFAEYGTTAADSLEVCKNLQIPLIVHFHGYDISERNTLKKYSAIYQDVFSYAKFIIGVSKKMMNDLLELGAPREKLIYAPYGPENIFFSIHPDPKNKKFLSVGRFVEKKAPFLTILAFKKLLQEYPDAILYLGGDGPLWNACKDLAEACGMEHQVFFPGRLCPEDVKKNMSDSIAYVQHSITAANGDSEGTPVAILEAGAAGLPVIATRHAGIPDVVIDGETGFLINEKDIDAMASCMSKVVKDIDFAKAMGYAARKRIKEHFTIERYIATLNQLIERALARSEK